MILHFSFILTASEFSLFSKALASGNGIVWAHARHFYSGVGILRGLRGRFWFKNQPLGHRQCCTKSIL
jgi:hypothetical protein